ncbi:MAG TPA: hypothetical protein VF128_04390 [Gemmatimonadaceae bacterium]
MNTMIDLTHIPTSRDETRQDVVSVLNGSWRGRLTDARGAAESFNLEREAVDHYVPGQVFLYTTPTGVAAGMRLLEAGDKAFVALIGPYFDPTEAAMVVTVLEGTTEAGGLSGTFHTRRYNWRTTLRSGHFTATRVEQISRAA